MPRPKVVEKRLKEILQGRLLRFTDILYEYQRRYNLNTPPFNAVSYGLKELQRKGEVVQIIDQFCLTSDLAGSLHNEALARIKEEMERLQRADEDWKKVQEAHMQLRLQQLNTASRNELKKRLKIVDNGIRLAQEWLASPLPRFIRDVERVKFSMLLLKKEKEAIEQLLKRMEDEEDEGKRAKP